MLSSQTTVRLLLFGISLRDKGVLFEAFGIAEGIFIAFESESSGSGVRVKEELLIDGTGCAFVWVVSKIAADGSRHLVHLKGKELKTHGG